MSPRPYPITAAGNLGPIGGANSGTKLYRVIVNTGAASAVLKLYDAQSAVATRIRATIDCSAVKNNDYAGALFKDGLFAVMSGGNADVTVVAD